MKSRGLAAQLIGFILTGAALIFAVAFAYNYQASKEALLVEVTGRARNLTMATANKIEVTLRSVEKIPLNLAAAIMTHPYDRDELLGLVDRAVKYNPEIFGAAVAFEPHAFNPRVKYFAPYSCRDNGRIKTTVLGGDSYQYFNFDWYQIPKELDRPIWSEPYYDEGAGNIIMSTFSVPFYRETPAGRQFRGVITADVSLEWLRDLVGAVKIRRHGYAFLISQNGVFVTHPRAPWIMRESVFSVAEAHNRPDLRRLGQEMIRGGQGFVSLTSYVTRKPSRLYYFPLTANGWSVAVIFPEDELFAPVWALTREITLIGLAGLAFLGVVIVIVARRVTRPLRTLAVKTGAIAQGDFAATVPERGPREIAHLGRSFNEMGRQLTDYIEKRDFIRDTFGRYVTQEVVKRLLESKEALELGGETREVSVLMSDIRGFSALTADMDPEQVIIFLNRYLGRMIEILLDYHAVIDEIVGDGIIAFFGAPEPMEDHALRAVACALSMQAAMDEINDLNKADRLPHLEMGIGVNTGAVVVGNIGSEKRTKYSVVGAHVNFTSRIEAFALGGQVLVSAATHAQVKDDVEVRDTIRAQMKGVPGTVTLHEVGAVRGPYQIELKKRLEALAPLKERLPALLQRISEKIVVGAVADSWITQLSETSALITFAGELEEWEDVRLFLLDATGAPRPGKIYGKVVGVKPDGEDRREAHIRFTSVSPELEEVIAEVLGSG